MKNLIDKINQIEDERKEINTRIKQFILSESIPEEKKILKTKSIDFDIDKDKDFVELYIKLMLAFRNKLSSLSWIGLSLIQVGVNRRIFTTKFENTKIVINPVIIFTSSKEIEEKEGCLSIKGLYPKTRSYEIIVEFYNENLQKVRKTLRGLEARCFLHEFDHLDWKLISD